MIKYQDIKDYLAIGAWPLFVFSIHILGQSLGAYSFVPWLDTPMHFVGGAAIAASSYYLFRHLENKKELATIPSVKVLIAIALTALAATVWEFSEYGGDLLLGTGMQPSIYDTMKDLCMGLSGATLVALYNFFRKS